MASPRRHYPAGGLAVIVVHRSRWTFAMQEQAHTATAEAYSFAPDLVSNAIKRAEGRLVPLGPEARCERLRLLPFLFYRM
jgi:hypothetical protein